MMFIMKRAMNIPGYHYFDSEASGSEHDNQRALYKLSLYTRFRILLDIIVNEYLSQILIFRWVFNIMRFSLVLLDKYPVLALRSFGKKYAYVEIMKAKK
jgi:hypothetical protein